MRGLAAPEFRVIQHLMIRSLCAWHYAIRALAFFIWRVPANMLAASVSTVVLPYSGLLRDTPFKSSRRWTGQSRLLSRLPKIASRLWDIPAEVLLRCSLLLAEWMWMNWSRSPRLWISQPGQTITGFRLSKIPSIRPSACPSSGRRVNFTSMADGTWWCLPWSLSGIANKLHEQMSIFSQSPNSSINVAGCETGRSSCRWFASKHCTRK